jgi:hypothetical protein
MRRLSITLLIAACGGSSRPPPKQVAPETDTPTQTERAARSPTAEDPPDPLEKLTGCIISKADVETDLGQQLDWIPAGGHGLAISWMRGDADYSNSVSILIGLSGVPAVGAKVLVMGQAQFQLREREGGVSSGDNVEGTLIAGADGTYDVTLEAKDMLRGMFNATDGTLHHFKVKVATIRHVAECK